MLKKGQTTNLKWTNKIKKHYVDLGYEYTGNNNIFIVKVEDLTDGSNVYVDVVCDHCGETYSTRYQRYKKFHSDDFGDTCQKCCKIKRENTCLNKYGEKYYSKTEEGKNKMQQTNLNKYGVNWVLQNKSIREKGVNTNIEKYGYDNPMKNNEVKEKSKDTCLLKYGKEYALQSTIVKEKGKNTLLDKYGVDNAAKSKEVQEKMKNTCRERYGVENIWNLPIYKQKAIESYARNGVCPTSKPQLELCDMLKKIYGNCELNKLVSRCFLDCVVDINGVLIDVEYDGWYWHKDRQVEDRKRADFIKTQGYKILRVKGSYLLPSKDEIIEKINYLINGNHSYAEIILEDWSIE